MNYRMKDGKEIKNDGKQFILKEEADVHSLTVNGIKRGDAGTFSPTGSCFFLCGGFGTGIEIK